MEKRLEESWSKKVVCKPGVGGDQELSDGQHREGLLKKNRSQGINGEENPVCCFFIYLNLNFIF